MEEKANQLISILEQVKSYITDDSNMAWSYQSAKELRFELEDYISRIQNLNFDNLDSLKRSFLPTCTFQEHSIWNGWGEEFLKLASEFDEIYNEINNFS